MLDVRSEADWDRAIAHTEARHGGLDILVNTREVWDEVMAVNLWGTFLGSRSALPPMRRRGGGAIANLCSQNAARWRAQVCGL